MDKSEVKENWLIIKGIHEGLFGVAEMSNGRMQDCYRLADPYPKYKEVKLKLMKELKRRGRW